MSKNQENPSSRREINQGEKGIMDEVRFEFSMELHEEETTNGDGKAKEFPIRHL
jgi:hypothetical protein